MSNILFFVTHLEPRQNKQTTCTDIYFMLIEDKM